MATRWLKEKKEIIVGASFQHRKFFLKNQKSTKHEKHFVSLYQKFDLALSELRKKCPYSELFWSTFSSIRIEYREIFPYSVRRGENADPNNSEYGHFLGSVWKFYFFGFTQKLTSFIKKHIDVKGSFSSVIIGFLRNCNTELRRVLLSHTKTLITHFQNN